MLLDVYVGSKKIFGGSQFFRTFASLTLNVLYQFKYNFDTMILFCFWEPSKLIIVNYPKTKFILEHSNDAF